VVELRRVFLAVLCVLGVGAGASVAAAASTGGAMATAPTPPAVITEISCVARCSSLDAAQSGSLLRVRGTAMSPVRTIVFLGARGAADDVVSPALRARIKSVDVLVPERALSGPLLAVNGDGGQSLPSRAAVSVQRAKASGAALDVRVVGKQVFVGAARLARVDLLAREPVAVAVALVRLSDGVVVQGWPLGLLTPGVVKTVTWDGTVAGVSQPIGRYEFRVFNQITGAQAAQTPTPLATGTFDLVDHKFPVRGKHTYGTGIAAFGAGRNGHTHQGQDVFAACGTPLVAARGGVVKLNQNEANAGNYLVIDGAGTDVDYVYMHMAERSPLQKGAKVMTGQSIGLVGDTGDAVGCHLHFEMWGKPGWYTGGSPFDPLPFLKAWDLYS
jgi:murein DD-endopeptidase MepM/ murein hydrolase activator NlpD